MAIYLKKKIAFRFETSEIIGYGHFIRCLSIAEKLNKKYSFEIYFVVNREFSSKFLIKNKRIKVIRIKKTLNIFNEEKNIHKLINDLKIKCIFFDIKKNYSVNFMKGLNTDNIKIITIDDKYNKRKYSDICFYPPVPQINKMEWSTFSGKKFVGWQYIPLREQFEKIQTHKVFPKKILILGGGSNSNNFIYNILKKINKFDIKLKLVILLGFNIKLNSDFKKILRNSHHEILLVKNKYFINKLIGDSSLIITPFGLAAYEIAALQRYSILFPRSKDDEMSASIFHKANIGYSIKNITSFKEGLFNKIINRHKKYLPKIKFTYSKYIRSGTERIAKIINESIKIK